jgi:hypothetical protein
MALEQILCALYVALCEASGGQAAREVADRVLRSAIINDEAAIEFLQSLCTDQDDEEPSSLH